MSIHGSSGVNNTSSSSAIVTIEETVENLPHVEDETLLPSAPERCCRISRTCLFGLSAFFITASAILLIPLRKEFDLSDETKDTLIAFSVLSGLIGALGFFTKLSESSHCCENRCTKWLWSWIKDKHPEPQVARSYNGRGQG